jgi:NAD(P)-dependent dehydrogenase (short-subunit alcohol dehydrogenase family)
MGKEKVMQLDGKRIIVTGGARGIGAGAVRAFAAAGARVASLDIRDEPGAKVAAEADKLGPGTVRFYHCDISRRSEVEDTFKSAVDHLGGLDALVNVAGVEGVAPAEEISDHEWDLIFATNIQGTLYTNQAAFRYLRDHGGRIINFSSGAGLVGVRQGAHYSASKGAVLAWTRTVAQEWGKYDITVNAIAPAIWTPMVEEARAKLGPEDLMMQDMSMAFAILIGGTLGDVDRDMAPVLVFLVSDAARFITGQTIAVDGGAVMVR